MRKRPEYQFLLQNGRALHRGSASNAMVRGFQNRSYYEVKFHRPRNQVTGESNWAESLGEREKHVARHLATHLPGGSRSGDARPSSDLGAVSEAVHANSSASPETAEEAVVQPCLSLSAGKLQGK